MLGNLRFKLQLTCCLKREWGLKIILLYYITTSHTCQLMLFLPPELFISKTYHLESSILYGISINNTGGRKSISSQVWHHNEERATLLVVYYKKLSPLLK